MDQILSHWEDPLPKYVDEMVHSETSKEKDTGIVVDLEKVGDVCFSGSKIPSIQTTLKIDATQIAKKIWQLQDHPGLVYLRIKSLSYVDLPNLIYLLQSPSCQNLVKLEICMYNDSKVWRSLQKVFKPLSKLETLKFTNSGDTCQDVALQGLILPTSLKVLEVVEFQPITGELTVETLVVKVMYIDFWSVVNLISKAQVKNLIFDIIERFDPYDENEYAYIEVQKAFEQSSIEDLTINGIFNHTLAIPLFRALENGCQIRHIKVNRSSEFGDFLVDKHNTLSDCIQLIEDSEDSDSEDSDSEDSDSEELTTNYDLCQAFSQTPRFNDMKEYDGRKGDLTIDDSDLSQLVINSSKIDKIYGDLSKTIYLELRLTSLSSGLLPLLLRVPKLETLNLNRDIEIESFPKFCEWFSNSKVVDLSFTFVKTNIDLRLLDFKKLTKFSFMGNLCETDGDAICQALKDPSCKITHMALSCTNLPSSQIQQILRYSKFKSLKLFDENYEGVDWSCLAQSTDLVTLEVRVLHDKEINAQSLLDGVYNLSQLRNLNLSTHKLFDQLESYVKICQLEVLTINYNPYRNEFITKQDQIIKCITLAILQGLRVNRTLKYIHFGKHICDLDFPYHQLIRENLSIQYADGLISQDLFDLRNNQIYRALTYCEVNSIPKDQAHQFLNISSEQLQLFLNEKCIS